MARFRNRQKLFIALFGFILLTLLGSVIFSMVNFAKEREGLISTKIEENDLTSRADVAGVGPTPPLQILQTKTCSNATLEISVHIPVDWSCNSGNFGYMKVNLNQLEITFTNEGGHGICGTTQSPMCTTIEFYTNKEVIVTESYSSVDKKRELRGYLLNHRYVLPSYAYENNTTSIVVLIEYSDMNNRRVTDSEFNQIKSVLDSLKITKQ